MRALSAYAADEHPEVDEGFENYVETTIDPSPWALLLTTFVSILAMSLIPLCVMIGERWERCQKRKQKQKSEGAKDKPSTKSKGKSKTREYNQDDSDCNSSIPTCENAPAGSMGFFGTIQDGTSRMSERGDECKLDFDEENKKDDNGDVVLIDFGDNHHGSLNSNLTYYFSRAGENNTTNNKIHNNNNDADLVAAALSPLQDRSSLTTSVSVAHNSSDHPLHPSANATPASAQGTSILDGVLMLSSTSQHSTNSKSKEQENPNYLPVVLTLPSGSADSRCHPDNTSFTSLSHRLQSPGDRKSVV